MSGSGTIAIDFSQVQQQVAEQLQRELADKASQGQAGAGQPEQPAGDEVARFQAYLEGPGQPSGEPSQVAGTQEPAARSPVSIPDAGAVRPGSVVSLGDRILANMSTSPSQGVSAQQVDPSGSVRSIGQETMVDPSQALDWQLQTIQLREELGLSATASQGTDQDVDSLLKAQ